jgi:hypothetical protein
MFSPHPESNGLGIVGLPEDRSGAFEAPIFDLGLFDTFAVSSTKKSPTSGRGRKPTTTAYTFGFRSAFSRWQYGAPRIKAGRKTMELRHQRCFYFVAVAKSDISPAQRKWLGIKQPALFAGATYVHRLVPGLILAYREHYPPIVVFA